MKKFVKVVGNILYQFPMGKVKIIKGDFQNEKINSVSIPNGKGKGFYMENKDDADIMYQFPMGKVKPLQSNTYG